MNKREVALLAGALALAVAPVVVLVNAPAPARLRLEWTAEPCATPEYWSQVIWTAPDPAGPWRELTNLPYQAGDHVLPLVPTNRAFFRWEARFCPLAGKNTL